MKKIAAAIAAGVLLAVVGAPDADAARQEQVHHSGASEKSGFRVYSGWVCNGSNDWVPRKYEAEIDTRSIRVPDGYSLWRIKPNGEKTRYITARRGIKSRCYTFAHQAHTVDSYLALRLGSKWGNG